MVEPVTVTVVTWLLKEAGKQFYRENLKVLYHNMGIIGERRTEISLNMRPMLDEYFGRLHEDIHRVRDRIDEDRLATLYNGLRQLKDASRTKAVEVFVPMIVTGQKGTSYPSVKKEC